MAAGSNPRPRTTAVCKRAKERKVCALKMYNGTCEGVASVWRLNTVHCFFPTVFLPCRAVKVVSGLRQGLSSHLREGKGPVPLTIKSSSRHPDTFGTNFSGFQSFWDADPSTGTLMCNRLVLWAADNKAGSVFYVIAQCVIVFA